MLSAYVPGQLRRFDGALGNDPRLVERIMDEFPAVEEPERVIVRTDAASADTAIARALELAVEGIETRLELT